MYIQHRTESNGRIARVMVDGSSRGNSFNLASLTELVDALVAATQPSECAVVRLEMVGPNFCSGWDTSDFGGLATSTVTDVADRLRASDEELTRLRSVSAPIVGAVRGKVIGFGIGLLAGIHLPIIADDATLTLPEVSFGFAPAGVAHTLAQALPRPLAYALLTGTTEMRGIDAAATGLATRAVPPDQLDGAVDEIVAQLASRNPAAVRGVVEAVESSTKSGKPDGAYFASARTIVSQEENR